MKLAKSLALLCASVVSTIAFAQVSIVSMHSTLNTSIDCVVGAIPTTSTTIEFSNCTWTSHPNLSLVSGGTAVTGGGTNPSIAALSNGQLHQVLGNASARGTITGGAFNLRYFGTRFSIPPGASHTAATITILGPTLNNYGLIGATNFSWTVTDDLHNTWTGTGEGTVNIPANSLRRRIQVYIEPTYYYENGTVMAQINF